MTASGQDGGPGRGPGEPRRAGGQRPQAPRGTYDVLPDQAAARAGLEAAARRILEPAGYGRIETPAFEATELFARGVGESTDIVQKEMYTFEDAGGRSLTLRPEGTAPVCRAYLEHGMHTLAQPVKLWYLSSYFRQEKPQAGRFRQFWQLGAEVIGSDDPAVDAETIALLHTLLGELDVRGPAAAPRLAGKPRRARGVPRAPDRLPARQRRAPERRRARPHRPQPAARLRRQGPRHPGGHARRAPAARLAQRRGPRALRRGLRPPARRGHRLGARRHARARHRLLHADDLRVHLRRAGCAVGRRRRRALRRPDRAARRPAHARHGLGRRHRADAAVGGGAAGAGADHRPLRRARGPWGGGLRADRRGARRRARGAAGAGRALAQGPAQAGRSRRCPLRCHPGRRRHPAARHGLRRAGGRGLRRGRGRPRHHRDAICDEAPSDTQQLPRRLGRRPRPPRASATRSAWPAGSIAAAITAG